MPSPLAERYKRVVFLGRQVKSKGIGDLIETMRFVWNVMPDAELLLPAFAFLKLWKLISRLLRFQRYGASRSGTSVQNSRCKKMSFFDRPAALILPSRTELFGIVIVEAWARATPVRCVGPTGVSQHYRGWAHWHVGKCFRRPAGAERGYPARP